MRGLPVAGAAALIAGSLAAGCSGGSADLCAGHGVRCEAPLSCDPDDGRCKCGGRGGAECLPGSACDPATNTCISSRCATVICSGGNSCDQIDGTCKCGGTGGSTCAPGEVCNPATRLCESSIDCEAVACPVNQTCDAATGKCVCGNAECAAGQSCAVVDLSQRVCIADLCSGVTCLGSTACDPADGRCKCNGAVCPGGSVCGCPPGADGGIGCPEVERSCQPGNACAGVPCTSGTTCDPTDGQCKCGGPGGPVCGADQVCSLASFQCQGGNQCLLPGGAMKQCEGGTSCDPEDGWCKCGGRGGEICSDGLTPDAGPAENCVLTRFSQVCRPRCDPRLQNCPSGTYCYFDTAARIPVAYCAVNSDVKAVNQTCTGPTACFTSAPTLTALFCEGLGTFDQPGGTGVCRAFCDTARGNCAQVPCLQACVQIPGAAPGVGICEPRC